MQQVCASAASLQQYVRLLDTQQLKCVRFVYLSARYSGQLPVGNIRALGLFQVNCRRRLRCNNPKPSATSDESGADLKKVHKLTHSITSNR